MFRPRTACLPLRASREGRPRLLKGCFACLLGCQSNGFSSHTLSTRDAVAGPRVGGVVQKGRWKKGEKQRYRRRLVPWEQSITQYKGVLRHHLQCFRHTILTCQARAVVPASTATVLVAICSLRILLVSEKSRGAVP